MISIKTNLTTVNFSPGRSGSSIQYLVFHYTANDGDTAEANANYFKSINRNASAHYFVDERDIVQVVKDSDTAWHCGDTQKYTNGGATLKGIVKNVNSIGIEMCSDKVNGEFVITEATQANAIELGKMLMGKYNIPVERVVRHYDVTGKLCPQPFFQDISQWNRFKARLVEMEEEDEDVIRYNRLSDIPDTYGFRTIVEKLMTVKIINGDGSDPTGNNDVIDLSHDMVRMLVFNYNAGVYDLKLKQAGILR
ncbi:peptidoglycan recognition protein family protein [Clostridium aminobutyricum]|uniref:N-acetylmuramoyl-L-alanine amidase n=1 Tax=Clostridium aminobutyricum TaxID=33953 RepID=A0A939D8L2_CLOAM|nr:N-acetylmuramoyl-L-alanine amidase [Clostridium aminobutyricum]MBN7773136.1 N-acetylmuramoyl-L-alanine amidase [Clostridium aminobutyricum]